MFNWDEFKNKKVAVNCDTEEKAREFIKECHERGMKWFFLNINDTNWSNFKESTCYSYSLNSGDLKFGHKSKFEAVDYKIIKWESEKMKFKVGDKVRIVSEGQIFPHYKEKFDELSNNINLALWEYGFSSELVNGTIVTIRALDNKEEIALVEGYFKGKECSLLIGFEGIEFVKAQAEFTFKEVIARIKEGETYQSIYYASNIQEITKNKKGKILLNLSPCRHIKDEVHIISEIKFKLQEPKRRVRIYKIEHQKNGKKYDFISSQLLDCDEFVICDTKCGKSYGRIAYVNTRELTEKEIEEYKECWRA